MQDVKQGFTEDEFLRELVARFFHPNSYFSYCLNHELESWLKRPEASDDDCLLFGTLVDRLVESENTLEELQRLAEKKGFAKSYEIIAKGAKYLREADLVPEKMKIEIEGLAKSVFESIMHTFQDEESRRQLTELLGGQEAQHNQDTGVDDVGMQDIYSEDTFQGDTYCESIFENEDLNKEEAVADDKSESLELEEPLSEGPVFEDPDISPVESVDATEKSDLVEMDFPPFEQTDMDVLRLGGYEAGISDESGSSSSNGEQSAARMSRVEAEPLSVLDVFQRELKSLLQDLQTAVNRIAPDSDCKEEWQACDRAFESLIGSAMIYGFDAFEQISAKARKFIAEVQENTEVDKQSAAAILAQTGRELASLLEGDIEKIPVPTVRSILARLVVTEELTLQKKSAEQLSPSRDREEPEQNSTPDIVPEPLSPDAAAIKIPGEDDEEILKLIEEIRNDGSAVGAEAAGRNEPLALNPADGDPVRTAPAKSPPAENRQRFQREAFDYFTLFERALSTLETKPDDRAALADIEMACDSLQGLSQKLHLEYLQRFPASVLSLVRNITASDYLLSEADHQLLLEGFRHYREQAEREPFASVQFEAALTLLDDLNAVIRSNFGGTEPDLARLSDPRGLVGRALELT